jgi:hypothetical protein
MTSPNLGPLVPVIYWPGSGSAPAGKTPLGLFDDDDEFQEEAPKIAKWIGHSLGYPVMQVELTDAMIYSQLEQAVTEFSALVNEFNMREYMLSIQGSSTGSNLTGVLVKGSPLPYIVELSTPYGVEARSGGNVDFKKGYITLQTGVQDYDLQALWAATSESGNRIEIRRVWHDRVPALRRFFDPFAGAAGSGMGIENLLGEFGWGNMSIASTYLLMPVYETVLRAQAIEFNDLIRRSQYSFEINNNKLRIFPVPDASWESMPLWFEYNVKRDKFDAILGNPNGGTASTGVISDYANAPYGTMQYQYINDVGKRWIRKYALALCKLMLGNIRNKYAQIPIPNSEVVMNGNELISQAQQEMDLLTQNLRETLNEAGKRMQMQRAKEVEENAADILRRVPNVFYIG